MANGLALVIDVDCQDGTSAGLPPDAWPAELEVQVCCRPNEALQVLQQLEANGRAPGVVVIRSAPKQALAAARQVHHRDPLVQMILVADAQGRKRLRQEMGMAPRIGNHWTIAPPGTEELPRLLLDALRATEQRRQFRASLDRARGQVGPAPPTEGLDHRRLVLSDRYLAAILTHAHDAILSTDPQGKILTANQATVGLTGYEPHELLSRSLEMLAAGQERELVAQLLADVRAGEPEVRREMHLRRRDGTGRAVDMMLAPVRDDAGDLLGISAIVRDISDRKQAEAALREQREWLRVTLNSIGDAVIATDTQGRVTFLNPVATALTGWDQQEAVGRSLDEVFVIQNEHTRQSLESPVSKVIRHGAVVGLANHTILIARDGTERPIDDSAAPIRDGDGEILGVVLVFHDISERRQIERELQERTQRLTESDRRKDEFLALLGHELRNPLAPLRNGLDVLALQDDSEPELTREIHAMMGRQVDQLVHLVDDLLDVSRISRGVLQLRPERVELGEIVTRAVETTRSHVQERQHALTVRLPEQPVWLEADPVRLEQIFCNLLTNAARYTEPGGQLRIGVEQEQGWVAVRVADNGIGIRPEMLSRIFDLFTQADRVSGNVHEGLGLGLTLVKSLTDLHGGKIEAYSAGLGQGSEFVVRLPALSESFPPEADPAAVPPAADPRPLRVLVVDDNHDAAESLAMLLRVAGHDVRLAFDGPSTLEIAPDYRPNLVLLDIGLPQGMNGYEVASQLRKLASVERPLLVALTGFGQESDRRRAQEAGFDAHLVKPAKAKAVHELIARAARLRDSGH